MSGASRALCVGRVQIQPLRRPAPCGPVHGGTKARGGSEGHGRPVLEAFLCGGGGGFRPWQAGKALFADGTERVERILGIRNQSSPVLRLSHSSVQSLT